ncbi:MAG: sensor histidine kinase [Candidatus Corynebacterium faecigallinarum]
MGVEAVRDSGVGSGDVPGYGHIFDLVLLYTPGVLLAVPSVTYLVWTWRESGQQTSDLVTVLGLVLLTGVWVALGHTVPTLRGDTRQLRMAVYFIGLLLLCIPLMLQADIFAIFTITGFFHAYQLRPWQMGVVGILATSLVINGVSLIGLSSPSPDRIVQFLLIVSVQTVAIGAGLVLAHRGEAEDRRRQELVRRLEDALHENAGLHAQLLAQARETGARDERQRLAREIHDTLAQGLAGIITQLQSAQSSRSSQIAQPADQNIERALELARSSLAEARRSLHELSPRVLGQARLPDALTELTERWAQDAAVSAQVDITGEQIPLSPAIEVALFRVVQEALTNVAKHAGASRVGVTLSYTGPEVLVDVRDDGRGFSGRVGDPGKSGKPGRPGKSGRDGGFGLTSMRQRIRGVGGHVEVDGAPGEGVSISVRVPAISPSSVASKSASDSGADAATDRASELAESENQ